MHLDFSFCEVTLLHPDWWVLLFIQNNKMNNFVHPQNNKEPSSYGTVKGNRAERGSNPSVIKNELNL